MKGLFRFLIVMIVTMVPLVGFTEDPDPTEPEEPPPVEELKPGNSDFSIIYQSGDEDESPTDEDEGYVEE